MHVLNEIHSQIKNSCYRSEKDYDQLQKLVFTKWINKWLEKVKRCNLVQLIKCIIIKVNEKDF